VNEYSESNGSQSRIYRDRDLLRSRESLERESVCIISRCNIQKVIMFQYSEFQATQWKQLIYQISLILIRIALTRLINRVIFIETRI